MKLLLKYLIVMAIPICNPARFTKKDYYCQEGSPDDIELGLELGQPLDFSFNETNNDNSDKIVSAPGCPSSIDGYPWVYVNITLKSKSIETNTTKCFLAGRKSRCPFGQILFAQSGSPYGVCGCECLVYPDYPKDKPVIQLDNGWEFCYSKSAKAGQMYNKIDKQKCTTLHAHDSCPDGNILALGKLNTTASEKPTFVCLPPCYKFYSAKKEKEERGECAETLSEGGGGKSTDVPAHECPEEESFSRILKKCVKIPRKKHFVIG